MPLVTFFCNVGAALLALLLIADFYLPTSPVVQKAAAYPPAIRIHTERKVPEPVVFDTTPVARAAATPAPWDSNPPPPPAASNTPADRADASVLRDAFAQLPRPGSQRAASAQHNKRQPTRKYAARGVRRHAPPQF